MGYRAERMGRDDSQINVERVYVLACRAHKLQRSRVELINIFENIIKMEEALPRVKQVIMNKLMAS